MAKSANGSTLTFDSGAVGDLRSISFSDNANEIDVTVLADTSHSYEAGIPDLECTCEVLGVSTLARGATGALAIAWNDGTSDAIADSLITAVESSGDLDGELTTSITFKPSG